MSMDDEFIPTRHSLLSRLRDWDDTASWQQFFDTYWKLIYRTARQAGLDASEAEDVVQETMVTVCKAMPGFQYDAGRGSFKGWLRTTTVWRIHDRLRKQQREKSIPVAASPETVPWASGGEEEESIASKWEHEWERGLAEVALERLKKKVSPKQFQIFDLAVAKEWPTARIAKTFNVSGGYVYLIKHRLTAQLKAELKKLKAEPCSS
jgi:RNA polymerase sigma factor (sigma-70 family)